MKSYYEQINDRIAEIEKQQGELEDLHFEAVKEGEVGSFSDYENAYDKLEIERSSLMETLASIY